MLEISRKRWKTILPEIIGFWLLNVCNILRQKMLKQIMIQIKIMPLLICNKTFTHWWKYNSSLTETISIID